MRKALELLEEEGLILREVGNGTTVTLKNHGNETAMDVIALAAPSRNPFFARFIAEFQRCAWEQDALLLYVEAPEEPPLRIVCTGCIPKISGMQWSGRMTGAWTRKNCSGSAVSA